VLGASIKIAFKLHAANRSLQQANELVWDDSMYRLYGLRQEDFEGAYQAFLRCIHPLDAARVDEEIHAALRSEKYYTSEFRIIKPSGSIRSIQTNFQTFRDQDGHPQRIIGTNIDITERKRSEEEEMMLN
jgi:PAS domain S-box-containing protein